jgi:hypothetical protein
MNTALFFASHRLPEIRCRLAKNGWCWFTNVIGWDGVHYQYRVACTSPKGDKSFVYYDLGNHNIIYTKGEGR